MTRWLLVAITGTLILALACSGSEQPSDSAPSQAAAEPTSGPPPSQVSPTPASTVQPAAAATQSPPPVTGQAVPPLGRPTEPPPRVDTSIASVPLSEIVFDTFRGGFIRLSEATDANIADLRDLI